MTLLEDLDELRLLVPDAPSLLVDVRKAAREYGEEAGNLLGELSTQQAEASQLCVRLEVALALLDAAAQELQTLVESAVVGLVPVFAEVRTRLAAERTALGAAETRTVDQVKVLGAQLTEAAQVLSLARSQATAAAAAQAALFEERKHALEKAVLDTGEKIPDVDGAVDEVTTAIEKSVAKIVSHVDRLGPLATGHLTDGAAEVKGFVADLSDAMNAVMELYGATTYGMAETIVEGSVSAGGELAEAGETLDTAALGAAQDVLGLVRTLAQQREAFGTTQETLETQCDAVVPYVDAAYRAEERLTGAN